MKYVSINAPVVPCGMGRDKRQFTMSRNGSLAPTMSVQDISDTLGFSPTRFHRDQSDNKTTVQWIFKVAGHTFGIWDYKGARWSVYSSNHEVMRQLFGDLFTPTITC